MPNTRVVIKKYENRRLYDTHNSRYVNLEDIAQMVRQGTEVEVIDAVTEQNLTQAVLTQIIVESAKSSNSGLPLELLRQMVIATGRVSGEAFLDHMRSMLNMYENAYEVFSQPSSGHKLPNYSRDSSPANFTSKPTAADPGEITQPSNNQLLERIEQLEKAVATNSRSNSIGKRKRNARSKRSSARPDKK